MRADNTGCGLPCSQRTEAGHCFITVGCAHSAENRVMSPMVIKRVRDIGQWHLRARSGHPVSQRGGHLGHALYALSADHQRAYRRDFRRLRLAHLGCLLKHDVGVRATEAER